ETWVREQVAIPGLGEIPLQQLYRAMDFLLEVHEELQREVYYAVADLLNLEVDLLYFDTTSTYFEIETDALDEDGSEGSRRNERPSTLRRHGHSKDHRPDLPAVVSGRAATRDGLPGRRWVWPGHTAGMSGG